ncbi:hypothetical protein AgCh_023092 [Apium graveolens]
MFRFGLDHNSSKKIWVEALHQFQAIMGLILRLKICGFEVKIRLIWPNGCPKGCLNRTKEVKDLEDEISASPILAPKRKDAPKEEPVDKSPLKPISSASTCGTSFTSKSAKGKRKVSSDDAKDVKPVKEEPVSSSKRNVPKKGSSSAPVESGSTVTGPVTEDEISAVLTQEKPVTTQDLVAKFKSRLKCKEVCNISTSFTSQAKNTVIQKSV